MKGQESVQKGWYSILQYIHTYSSPYSIREKLHELGWAPSDTENLPYAVEAEEYSSILCQPTLLNDSSE
jgi:hypothetical protein